MLLFFLFIINDTTLDTSSINKEIYVNAKFDDILGIIKKKIREIKIKEMLLLLKEYKRDGILITSDDSLELRNANANLLMR